MKHITLFLLTASLLSACTAGTSGASGMSVGVGLGTTIGNHVGLGTSLNIPISLGTGQNGNRSDHDQDGINIINQQIVTYFDAHGTPTNSAVKGGFYRQLLSKRNNEYVVQDFYGDNGQKRTDPYTLNRDQLIQFRATPVNGSLTTYAYNGQIMQQQVFQNGKLIRAQY